MLVLQPFLLVVAGRWLLLPAYILGIISLSEGNYTGPQCQIIFRVESAIVGLAQISGTSIFSLRCWSIYERGTLGKAVQSYLLVATMGWIALWMYSAGVGLDATYEGKTCIVTRAGRITWSPFLYALVYDLTLVLLLCYRLSPYCDRRDIIDPGQKPSYMTLLFRQGVLYYLAATAASIWAMAWFWANPNPPMSNFGANIDSLVVVISASKASLSFIKRSIRGHNGSRLLSGSSSNELSSSRPVGMDFLGGQSGGPQASTSALPIHMVQNTVTTRSQTNESGGNDQKSDISLEVLRRS